MTTEFELSRFLPYLLNQAAEASGEEFQAHYRAKYGMLRTEWRVLFHIGCYGKMSAKDICNRASIHKTKVSRAVSALEAKRFVLRSENETDRRFEYLDLTKTGTGVFKELQAAAETYETKLTENFTHKELESLRINLERLSKGKRL